MGKWNSEKYKNCLQLLQTGEYDQPIEQLVDNLHAEFHALYEDFMVEDTENNVIPQGEFTEAAQIYFELGCALLVKNINTTTERLDNVQKASEKVEQKPANDSVHESLENLEQKSVKGPVQVEEGASSNQKSMDWASDDDELLVIPKPAIKSMPYHVLSGIISPILELPQCNLISDLIINEIIHKCELVQQRIYRAEDFSEREEKIIVAVIESKLDPQTRMMWNWDLADGGREPDILTMMTFLRKREQRISPSEKRAAREFERKFMEEIQTTDVSCPYCRGKHKLCRCDKFKALQLGERWDVVERLRVCVNCFSKAHLTVNCREGACRKCRTMHNSLMCSQSYTNN